MLEFPTSEVAKQFGYCPVTESYYVPSEGWMMERVLKDLNGQEIALVEHTPDYKSIWRKKIKLMRRVEAKRIWYNTPKR